jgi:hypothetical protein
MKRHFALILSSLALAAVPVAVVACSAETAEEETEEGAGAARAKEKISPVPGTDNNELNVKLVVTAMKRVQKAFYPTADANGVTPATEYEPSTRSQARQADEIKECFDFCPSYWSDLVCHFYCSHPSYALVSPNVRGCFSNIVRGGYSVQRKAPDGSIQPLRNFPQDFAMYPKVYDYCLFASTTGQATGGGTDAGLGDGDVAPAPNPVEHGFDVVLHGNDLPVWDDANIEKNKKAKKKIGVLKWVDDNEREAFRHVMFTWYNPNAFSMASQQEALNEFYGVKLANPNYTAADAADVAACKAKRLVAPYDPQDGTHCSHAKQYGIPRTAHPNFAAALAYMNQLAGIKVTAPADGGAGDGGP